MSERELKNLLDDTARAWAEKKRREKAEEDARQRKVAREVRNLEALILALKWAGAGALIMALVLLALAKAGVRF